MLCSLASETVMLVMMMMMMTVIVMERVLCMSGTKNPLSYSRAFPFRSTNAQTIIVLLLLRRKLSGIYIYIYIYIYIRHSGSKTIQIYIYKIYEGYLTRIDTSQHN
jgi:hypothetical protein